MEILPIYIVTIDELNVEVFGTYEEAVRRRDEVGEGAEVFQKEVVAGMGSQSLFLKTKY